MNLTPMNSDELNTQSDVFQELSKDTMLEKVILYVVSYFCVGTEIRFQATKMEKKESPQQFLKVWSSEMWHGKSLQVACMFLPEDCPLVDHIMKSYKKHYTGKYSLLLTTVKPKTRQKPQSVQETKSGQTIPDSQGQNEPLISQQKIKTLKSNEKNNENNPINHSPFTKERQSFSQERLIQEQLPPSNQYNQNFSQPLKSNSILQQQQQKEQLIQQNSSRDSKQIINRMRQNNIQVDIEQEQQQNQIQCPNPTQVPTFGLASDNIQQVKNVKTHVIKNKNFKQMRHQTLKDMVLTNLKNGSIEEDNKSEQLIEHNHTKSMNITTSGTLHSKVPPKSPEDSAMLNEESSDGANIVFSRGSMNQRKLSHSKPLTMSGASQGLCNTATAAESKEIEKSSKFLNLANSSQKSDPQLDTDNILNRNQTMSPSVRLRTVHSIKQSSQQTSISPQPNQSDQEQLKEKKVESAIKTRPYTQSVTYNDNQRLSQNYNNQFQQQNEQKTLIKVANKDTSRGKGIGISLTTAANEKSFVGNERPQSAQQSLKKNSAPQKLPPSSFSNCVETRPASNGNNNSYSTQKLSHHSSSRKRYQEQPTMTSTLQKLINKPNSKQNHVSKVLQGKSINSQAWTSAPGASGAQQSKQKVIMLQKQKKPTSQGQTVLWLAQNPASDKLQSKHPIQIGTTKFVDSQMQMITCSSNSASARGAKKQTKLLCSDSKKLDFRKKQLDLPSSFESGGTQAINNLSKTVLKEKIHQVALQASIIGPSKHKIKLQHHIINKQLNSTVQQQTLKKSASTHQVVSLLDLQQQQYASAATKQQQNQHLLSKHGPLVMNKLSVANAHKLQSGASAMQINFKTLSKKHNNTKSTSLLHNNM